MFIDNDENSSLDLMILQKSLEHVHSDIFKNILRQ